MDSGEEFPALNETWTFGGAKFMEWMGGLVMSMIVCELMKLNPGQAAPFLLGVWIGTTLLMAGVRKQFPDEERGICNLCMTKVGFPPPGIPAPAPLQPTWSGAPTRRFPETSYYEQLNLACLFPEEEDEED